jgi:hypothetical protein
MHSRHFRLYGVTAHDTTTREYVVPEFEINVLRAAWRGVKLDVVALGNTREITMNAAIVWSNLRARYQPQHLMSYYPGPERLEADMAAAADKTDLWLKDRAAWQEQEDARLRKASEPQKKAG